MMNATSLERHRPTEIVTRVRRGLRRHGFGGSIRVAGALLARLAYLRESHVWYLLDLHGETPSIGLPSGMRIARAREDDLPLLAGLPTVGLPEARRRLVGGADLWLVLAGTRAVFACWTFPNRVPALAARGGWLELPRGIVGLEDSITSPDYRGRGIASGAYSAIAAALACDGVRAILTKIEPPNVAVRRAVEKAGFRAVAAMRLRRIGWRSRVEVDLHGPSEAAVPLERLAR